MVKRPKSNDVEFDPVAALQSLTLVAPSTTQPFSEPILHTPSRRSYAPPASPDTSVRGQDASTLAGHRIAGQPWRTQCPPLLLSRPNRPRVLRKVPTKDCEQDNTRKTAAYNYQDSESGTSSAANANTKGNRTISLMSGSSSQSNHPTQRDSVTDGTGSGGPEKLSHLRTMTNSGLGKNKVTAILPESAAKFYAQGADSTKDVTKVEVGFDDCPEQAQASGAFKRPSNDDAGRTPLLNPDQKILATRGMNSVDEIAKQAPRFSQVFIADGLLGKNGDNEDDYMNGRTQNESDTERDYTQDDDEKEEEDEVRDDDEEDEIEDDEEDEEEEEEEEEEEL